MEERGLTRNFNRQDWVNNVASRKVDLSDFEEVLEAILVS